MSHNPQNVNDVKRYFVSGGVFKDTKFKEVVLGTYEYYGTFTTYKEAYDIWKAKSWINVDNCHHKLFLNYITIFQNKSNL